jgi:hypothetical protein
MPIPRKTKKKKNKQSLRGLLPRMNLNLEAVRSAAVKVVVEPSSAIIINTTSLCLAPETQRRRFFAP